MPELSWMTLGGAKQLVVQDALLTILRELSYFSWFTPITNMGNIGQRSGDDDPLGLTLQMGPGFLHGGEDASRLPDILSTSITPFDVSRISLLVDSDGLPIDDKLPILSLGCAIEFGMGRVILKHVDHVVGVNEGVVDGTISTLPDPEQKAALVTRRPVQPNSFTLTLTNLFKGQG